MRAYPPTPAKRIGKGEIPFKEAMRREPIVSPETSPETMKTLSSPSLAAMSIGALRETEKDLTSHEKPLLLLPFKFHIVLNNISNIS